MTTISASPRATRFAVLALLGVLTACGPATISPGDSVVDRDEAQNREVHRFNVGVDRYVLSPVADAYGNVVPNPVRTGVSNFSSNLNQPGYVLNNLLQLRIGDAAQNTMRFLLNSSVGIGGIFDPATAIGLDAARTDFGETLHVYGLPEGAYTELWFLGPSTSRHALGRVVDFAMNPTRVLIDAPQSTYVGTADTLDILNQRYELDGVIDGVLYDSADSYAAARSLYLQQRRFQLSRGSERDDGLLNVLIDLDGSGTTQPDVVGGPGSDVYFDPYGN